jgi:hypothetical protein
MYEMLNLNLNEKLVLSSLIKCNRWVIFFLINCERNLSCMPPSDMPRHASCHMAAAAPLPESGTAWAMALRCTPRRWPPPRAAQRRARSGLQLTRRAYNGSDRTWLVWRPLEALSKVRLLCSPTAIHAAVGVRARSRQRPVGSSWTCRAFFFLGGHHCYLGGMDARAAASGGWSHGCLSSEHHRAGGGCILWPFGRQ